MKPYSRPDVGRKVLLSAVRMSPIAVGAGVYFGWVEGRWSGAAIGAALMAFVFLPCACLVAFALVRRQREE
jgi:hypothetical protein